MLRIGSILMGLALVTVADLQAQEQRIGFINSSQILERMPEYEGIDQRLQMISDAWYEELEQLEAEIERLELEFETREVLFTEEMRERHQAEISTLADRHQQILHEKFGPDGEYFERQRELLEPVQQRLLEAVNRVALREGFDFVFDRAEEVTLLHADPEWNLNGKVLEELGLIGADGPEPWTD